MVWAVEVCWVILTRGDRMSELAAATRSVAAQDGSPAVAVVWNDSSEVPPSFDFPTLEPEANLGVPGGRDFAVRRTDAAIIGFLDDDAELLDADLTAQAVSLFSAQPSLGVISLGLVDDQGVTSRRHKPHSGDRPSRSGQAATFLGGACLVRRSAYEAAGGYDASLFYGHEELDLTWRLAGVGFHVQYEPNWRVFHPRTEVGRHADGWWRTGRNRVVIARKNLPVLLAGLHVFVWLVVGIVRASDWRCRGAYLSGWWSGWSQPVVRKPITWRTAWSLMRRGRPLLL